MKLSPPEYTLQRKLYYTFGVAGDVRVTDVQRLLGAGEVEYVVRIITNNKDKGHALSTIIKNKIQISHNYLQVVVEDSNGNPYSSNIVDSLDHLVQIAKVALSGNPLFVSSQKARHGLSHELNALGIVITRSVIHFWNDDLSDIFSAYNGIAADVFKELLAEQRYPIVFGTAP